ncbi:MAG: DnaB-like helicase C-terminal domain-containing protein [Candidatus Muiribacteriota bacterium]|jgi:archaellum biogenesis ATPase FlaH
MKIKENPSGNLNFFIKTAIIYPIMKKKNFLSILENAIQEKSMITGFPILDNHLNGIWNELYILSGASSMGKTTFLTQLSWNFVEKNENTEIIFFSLDHPASDISIKIASQSTEIPFSYLKNLKNDNVRYDRKLERKLKNLKKYYQNISIYDSSYRINFNLDVIFDIISKKRQHSPEKQLVIFIDQLYSLTQNDRPAETIIEELKKACHYYNISIFLAMSLPGEAEVSKPSRINFKEFPFLLSKSYAFFTIYTDFIHNYETPFMEWDWQHDNTLVPVSELIIHKNKIEKFTGSLFYKFYNETSMFRECLQIEIDNYKKMNDNLTDSKKRKKISKKKNESDHHE